MSDIRRSILWVIFAFSLILLWDAWQVHNGRPKTFFPAPQDKPAATAPAAVAQPVAALPGAAPLASDAAAPEIPRQTHVVSTDVLKLSFDSEGGSLIGADLLKHRAAGQDAAIRLLTQDDRHTYVAQTGLLGSSPLPTHKAPMRLVGKAQDLAEGQDSLTLRFESAPVGGVVLAKTYTLKRGGYDIAVRHEVINQGAVPVSPALYLQLVRDGSTKDSDVPFASTFTGPAVYSDAAKFQKIAFEDVDKGKADFTRSANDGYVAMVQHYFATAWLLDAGIARDNYAEKVPGGALYRAGMKSALGEIAPGQSKAFEARLFVGPQEEKLLERLAPGLELVKDYGWTTIVAKPLYWLLEKIHAFVGNWGWSIVLLVVVIKAAFYWLNANAYRSMAKMKAINPRIQEMRERLKDKPQQMQQEMMRIYREEKVNPLGGCLPILIQIPVFIALYTVLLASVEMRNAPWVGWITDLSSKDPFYILPVVLTLTTVIQTALNPLPPDPMQAKMMWIMPLVFSVMFFSFPAGLVLYWITNNTLTILQQAHINRRMGVPLKITLPTQLFKQAK
ncbi:membrane protein insertase YidC [Malikia sp.]|uniref:membrane protein insertase YidC n=1 Tax=Malikia sp. TaxID=2070706 RepID=UPI002610B01A|nr:membrane protein insertase YidC [Malikia sp.]MDD2730086.1 membrane protein insertase YidC [Malikia sp.]